jgi:hypothetical protein
MKLFRYNKETLTFDKVTVKPKVYLAVVAVILTVYWLGWTSNIQIINRIIHHKSTDTVLVHGQPFSEKSLIKLLKISNMEYPHIVLAQAKIESGKYKSRIFKQNNNLFGMKKAYSRVTTTQGDKDGFAYYRDWIDCVYDMGLWQSTSMCNVSTEEQYLSKLAEIYAEDTSYVSMIKTVIEKEKLKSLFQD